MQARGVYGVLAAQYEGTYGVDPGTPDLTLIPFETEGFKSSRNLISSAVKRGNRLPTAPVQGNIDVSGSVATELGVYPGMLYVAAAGSVKTEANSGTGESLGSALTTPTGVIDEFNQTLTVTSTTHSLAVGDVVNVAGITAPTGLNDTYLRVVSVTSPDIFVCRIPLGISGTFTLGAGTIKKVSAAATTYKHTIQFGGRLPSLVVEKGYSDIAQYFQYNGCVCSGMTVNTTPEGFQKVSFNFSGQKETIDTSSFDAAPTALGKTSFEGFQLATIEEGGVAIANVTKVDFSIDNGLDTGQYVMGGDGLRGGLPEGLCKVTGTLEALFENTTLYAKAVAGTESSLELTWSIGTGAGTAGNESMTLTIPEMIFKQDAPVIGGDGGVLVTLPFEAYYHNGSEGVPAQIVLLSTQLAI